MPGNELGNSHGSDASRHVGSLGNVGKISTDRNVEMCTVTPHTQTTLAHTSHAHSPARRLALSHLPIVPYRA